VIILLNGSVNSGKTTVAEAIVARSIGFAHIEVDSLRDFIRWMPLEETIELNLQNAITIATNFHSKHISSVISYPLSKSDFEFIKDLLNDSSIEVHAVALYPGIDQLKTNRGNRELSEWEVNRIDELHRMGVTKPDFGTIIDNSSQTVEETVDSVLNTVGFTGPNQALQPTPGGSAGEH
jgi:adenylate kinase family enzyme